jgi:hypothetical protein
VQLLELLNGVVQQEVGQEVLLVLPQLVVDQFLVDVAVVVVAELITTTITELARLVVLLDTVKVLVAAVRAVQLLARLEVLAQ